MIKRFLQTTVLILTVSLIGGLTSCKKCYQCTALDEDNAAFFDYQEICGTKRDFKNYEARCEAEYGNFGYTCSCEEI